MIRKACCYVCHLVPTLFHIEILAESSIYVRKSNIGAVKGCSLVDHLAILRQQWMHVQLKQGSLHVKAVSSWRQGAWSGMIYQVAWQVGWAQMENKWKGAWGWPCGWLCILMTDIDDGLRCAYITYGQHHTNPQKGIKLTYSCFRFPPSYFPCNQYCSNNDRYNNEDDHHSHHCSNHWEKHEISWSMWLQEMYRKFMNGISCTFQWPGNVKFKVHFLFCTGNL